MKIKTGRHLALSFTFPMLILGIVFALHGVYPFGGKQILVRDFLHQYYPFLSNFWQEARTGSLSPWSWTAGGDYTALFAYYLASPLNLFTLLFPHAWMREVLTVLLLIKIGCAGLFMSCYLRYAFRQPDHLQAALPVFSTVYALCAFTLGYYWNIMWFDGFALLPLVMLGVLGLMREGKYMMYTASLGLAILANFYIGLFICIFSAITFLGQSIVLRPGAKTLLRKLLLIAGCSALAIGLAAVLLIPAYSSLQNTYTSESGAPARLAFYYNLSAIMGNFIAFTPPTVMLGPPNLYSGMISILLTVLFIRSKKIPGREKLVFLGIIAFLLISCNVNILYYAWNGFHITNSMPFRFSFLISFTLAAAAYRAFRLSADIKSRDILAMGITAALFLFAAFTGPQENIFVIGNAVLCVIYLLLLSGAANTKKSRLRAALFNVIFLLILVELSISAFIGVLVNQTSPRDNYPDRYDQVQELLNKRKPAGPDFFRTELTGYFSWNDPSLYNYRGVSCFSSTVNVNTTRFMRGLGLLASETENSYLYTETTPLINAFLNIQYLISPDGRSTDKDLYWGITGTAGDSVLLENRRYLPLGFMVNEDTVNYTHTDNDPFLSQNNLFRRATGLDTDIFTVSSLSSDPYAVMEDTHALFSEWRYTIPADGIYYVYINRDTTRDNLYMEIYSNGNWLNGVHVWLPHILTLGSFSQGDIISFVSQHPAPPGGDTLGMVGFLNTEVFDRGHALLADEPLRLTHFSGTKIGGHITAFRDGLLYTSIPCDDNWSAYIDGVKSETLKIGGAMIALRLNEGTHNIEFRYRNKSLWAGITISLVSLAILAALIFLDRRRKRAYEG